MNLLAILSKTAKGAEEIATRKYKLEQRLRSLLIVVNGTATAGELLEKFEPMGDITPKLEKLLAEGFIAADATTANSATGATVAAQAFEAARAHISRALSDTLGPAAEGICLKLEECRSAQELAAFLEARRDMLNSALSRRSDAFWAQVKATLG